LKICKILQKENTRNLEKINKSNNKCEEEIKKKSRYGVSEAVRWLAEKCLYLIKKYPGRVFYKK